MAPSTLPRGLLTTREPIWSSLGPRASVRVVSPADHLLSRQSRARGTLAPGTGPAQWRGEGRFLLNDGMKEQDLGGLVRNR